MYSQKLTKAESLAFGHTVSLAYIPRLGRWSVGVRASSPMQYHRPGEVGGGFCFV